MAFSPLFYFFTLFTLAINSSNAQVSVIESQTKRQVSKFDNSTKYIYLTFDDGPLLGTSNCIDICTHQQAQATFFEVGLHQERAAFGKGLYERIIQNQSLFALGNHSYSHANNKYLYYYHHPDMAFHDFLKSKSTLKLENNIVRLPGNNAWNTTVLKKSSSLVTPLVHKLDSASFNVIGWDVEWRFNKKGFPIGSPQKMANRVDAAFASNHTSTKNHLVILMHDHMFRSPGDSLKLANLIGLLKTNPNYAFRKITQYPGLINGGR